MQPLNRRNPNAGHAQPKRKRLSLLLGFPEEGYEAVAVQWDTYLPTVLIQRQETPTEPIQFLESKKAPALDLPLDQFVDATDFRPFGQSAYLADLLFSATDFSLLQPEPDLMLPPGILWECRKEALKALGIPDEVLPPLPTEAGLMSDPSAETADASV